MAKQKSLSTGYDFLMNYCRRSWISLWHGNPPGIPLVALGFIVAAIMSIPILYVVWRSIFAGSQRWLRLLDDRVPMLLWNTLTLTVAVTVASLVLGVFLAWVVIRTDLPGKRIWRWALALPLAIPPYVGAVTYIIILGRSGWLRDLWISFPWLMNNFGDYALNIYSFGGAFFVLTMFTYPYVYLITSAAMIKLNRNYEEAARSLGLSPWEVFWQVTFPSLRPAMGAGGILVALYVLSDFGAVAMLRYVTFTAAIYFQRASFDTASAAVLSLVLIVITVIILWAETFTRRKGKFHQTSNTFREILPTSLGRFRYLALIVVGGVFGISVAIPISVLVYWSRIGLAMGALDGRFVGFVYNSLQVSGLAAALCMGFALPIVYLKVRYPSVITRLIDRLCYAGYALPGVIVALGFVFIFNNHIPVLYGTFYMIALAFVVRFLPQAMQSTESSLCQLSSRVDEAARSLGYPPWKVMLTVILPNILPGVFAGGALVFVSAVKELPASLMLRPPGFDTLAVRIYFDAHDSLYHLAAPGALLIVLVSVIPLYYLLKKY